MKKVFLLTFCGFLFISSETKSEVFSITDINAYQPKGTNSAAAVTPNLPDPNDEEAVRKFFKERLENAVVTKADPDDDYTVPSSINVVHTPEYYRMQEEKNKPLFQKMYEEAVRVLQKQENAEDTATSNTDLAAEEEAAASATRFFTVNAPKKPRVDDRYANEPPIPTVAFSLPSGRRMLAPAVEHIPYFLSYIDIQANGYLKIEDTIITVADGKKFLKPMQRFFSKYTYDEKGRPQRVEIILKEVLINNVSVPYTIEEAGNNIIIKPKYNQTLEAGVYTYTFNYLVNHNLQIYYDNVIMNWHLTGQPLNAFITSANAIITLPTGHTFKNVQGIIGKKGQYTNRRSNIIPMAENVAAISNFTPLLNGENMNLVAIADKSAFLPNFKNSFNSFMFNWGNVIYAALGFMAVLLAYLLSLLNLRHQQKSPAYNPSYNGSLVRNIIAGKYDRIAFTAQILDLYRKKALDLNEENNHILLIKKNIVGANLNKTEKKALKRLFAKKSSTFEINTNHGKILQNIYQLFERYNLKQIKKINLMHNMVYIFFSCAMLLLTEIFIAGININFWQTLIILLITSVLYAFYIWILRHKFKHWYVNIPVKILTLSALLAVFVFSSIYIDIIPDIFVLSTIITIFAFTKIFNTRNNFMNEAVKAINTYKEYLVTNADTINLSHNFLQHQANIFALDVMKCFPKNATNSAFYKLEVAEHLHRALVGIL